MCELSAACVASVVLQYPQSHAQLLCAPAAEVLGAALAPEAHASEAVRGALGQAAAALVADAAWSHGLSAVDLAVRPSYYYSSPSRADHGFHSPRVPTIGFIAHDTENV